MAETQEVLLQVLATQCATEPAPPATQGDLLMQAKARQQAQRTGGGVAAQLSCDRCGGPHLTHLCPYYSKEREDAQMSRPKTDHKSHAPVSVLGRAVQQPGDGACLFHSLAHHLGGSNGQALRCEVADCIESNPNLEVAGTPLHKWVAWDCGLAPSAYAAKLRVGAWGGALEMAVIATTFSICIHVYEQQPGSSHAFKRMASFGPPGIEPVAAAHVVYRGRVHYDALEVDSL